MNSLSDIKYKVMVIRMFREFSANYKDLSGNNIIMKEEKETLSKSQLEMKNEIYEKRTL